MKHNENALGIQLGKYRNGQHCIQLFTVNDRNYPYAIATVAIDHPLQQNEVAIKNYSENEGMLHSLIIAGIVEQPHRYISSGFVQIPICKFTACYQEAFGIAPCTDSIPA